MNILILVNEPFEKMAIGSNTTLAYILAAVEQNHQVYIYQFKDEKIPKISDAVMAIHLNKDNASWLVEEYKNLNIAPENKKYFDKKIIETAISFSEIDFVIQRLEPMKAPFPPKGKIDIEDFLVQIKNIFPPHFVFNAPINCYKDKEFSLLFENFATPTAISFAGDKNILEKTKKIGAKFTNKKFVFKPDNSAQAFGVFAIKLKKNGLNLAQIYEKSVEQLILDQSYEINEGEDAEHFAKIIDILCYVQFCKTSSQKNHELIKNIKREEIKNGIDSLYGDKILIQPFLEVLSLGDIRINLAKMSDGNFKVVGALFRKAIIHDEKSFTTGFMSGRSMPELIENCTSKNERQNLKQQIEIILQKLNGELQEKYKNCVEIGCDFILAGNNQDVYFGEANHYCQGLIPLAEMTQKNSKENNFYEEISDLKLPYDGGLAITKEIIKQQIELQK